MNQHKAAKYGAIFFFGLTFGAGPISAMDWPTLRAQMLSKKAQFEKEIRDMSVVQEMNIVGSGQEGKGLVQTAKFFMKGKKWRSESAMPVEDGKSFETTTIFDGRETWSINPFMGKSKLSPKDQNRQPGQAANSGMDLINKFPQKGKVKGPINIQGKECYAVEFPIMGEDGVQLEWRYNLIHIDKNSLNIVRMEMTDSEYKGKKIHPDSKRRIDYLDFKRIKGAALDWPFKTEIYDEQGRLTVTIKAKSVEINKGLSDDLFNADKVKGGGNMMEEMMKQMKSNNGRMEIPGMGEPAGGGTEE